MKWIKVKDRKPDNYQQCWVMHIKRPGHQYHSIYYEPDDTFRLILKDTHDYPLNITHWAALPEYMSEEIENNRELEEIMGCKIVYSNGTCRVLETGELVHKKHECVDSCTADTKEAYDEYAKWKQGRTHISEIVDLQ